MINEVDIDFRIPGSPHSVVKQADNYRVRELVKQIENHPHRQSLQRDLQQKKAYNPFSEKSKNMIQDMARCTRLVQLVTTTAASGPSCFQRVVMDAVDYRWVPGGWSERRSSFLPDGSSQPSQRSVELSS